MLHIHDCPSCGGKRIARKRGRWEGRFMGKKFSVPGLEWLECPDCGEKVYDREALRKIEARSPAYAKANANHK